MNEATVKAGLTRYLREWLAGAVVIRHEDVSTDGVPDLSITYRGRTYWVEVKTTKRGRPLANVTAIQLRMLRRLAAASPGRVAVVNYDLRPEENETVLYGVAGGFQELTRGPGYMHRLVWAWVYGHYGHE